MADASLCGGLWTGRARAGEWELWARVCRQDAGSTLERARGRRKLVFMRWFMDGATPSRLPAGDTADYQSALRQQAELWVGMDRPEGLVIAAPGDGSAPGRRKLVFMRWFMDGATLSRLPAGDTADYQSALRRRAKPWAGMERPECLVIAAPEDGRAPRAGGLIGFEALGDSRGGSVVAGLAVMRTIFKKAKFSRRKAEWNGKETKWRNEAKIFSS